MEQQVEKGKWVSKSGGTYIEVQGVWNDTVLYEYQNSRWQQSKSQQLTIDLFLGYFEKVK